MAHRANHPQPLIIRTVIKIQGESWNKGTRDVVPSDAERIVEAMVAEYGVDAAVRALNNQGFDGDALRYLLNPLYAEAMRRRAMIPPEDGAGGSR